MNSTLNSLVKLKSTAKKHSVTYTVYEDIKKNIEKIPNLIGLKNDTEFLNYVCNLFENGIDTKKYNANKKELVLKLYSEIFNDSTPEYLKVISDDIDYLWNHGNIKKIKIYKKLFNMAYIVLKKFVLCLTNL